MGGGFGAVVMNGIKRGLFSNEAGSGSAPCAAAAAECDDPVKMGLVQALGVLIDTIVICSCTPRDAAGSRERDERAAGHGPSAGGDAVPSGQLRRRLHRSDAGTVQLLYFYRHPLLRPLQRGYLFGDSWFWQTAYKVLALVMLVVGGMQAYTVVWDLGDVGIGLMTIFNMLALYPLSGEALTACGSTKPKRNSSNKKASAQTARWLSFYAR